MNNTVTVKFIEKGPQISDELEGRLEHSNYYTPVFNGNNQSYQVGLDEEELQWVAKKLKMKKDDINPIHATGEPHSFWDSTRVRAIMKNTTIFNLNNALDFVKYKYLVEAGIVAPTEDDLNKDKYINAVYYVTDSEEAEKIKAQKINTKRDAYVALSKLTDSKIKEVATILEKEPMGADSNEYCIGKLGEHIENNPEKFLRVVNMSASQITAMAVIEEACAMKIMDKKPYMFQGKELGPTVEEAAKTLSSKTNAELYSTLKKKIAE